MRILIVGGGGREHALAWHTAWHTPHTGIFCAPGNPGMASVSNLLPVDAADPDALLALAERESIDLTVIGPELPLDRGAVDRFRAAGRRIFGPPRAAAQLECSKVFAKGFMARHGIPTARYRVCESSDDARRAVSSGEFGYPVVLKADGLAAGKRGGGGEKAAGAEGATLAPEGEGQFCAPGARPVGGGGRGGPPGSFFAVWVGPR